MSTTVSEIARQISAKYGQQVQPRAISELFYKRVLSDADAPIVSGRRMIDPSLVPAIEIELRRAGHLPRLPRRVQIGA
ncbi:MAG: hypothetical protein SGJ20_10795 [Planctomycetota bacterium]|nr:hypothetical protein [Planctomycetia bacterium]MDZ4819448.1 hypothetical protein [Planctomycetota bacterium]